MRNILHFLLMTNLLVGCQRQDPKPLSAPEKTVATGIKPFTVKNNSDIVHEFYRDVSLEAFLKTLPTGAADSVNLDLGNGPQIYATVKVPEQAGKDLTKLRFVTTFITADGQKTDTQWQAAEGRTSGTAKAIFSLPPTIVDGNTKVIAKE